MRLLLFNPENDLALAANDPHYTPPASAVQMRRDMSWFPALWAKDGDIWGVWDSLPFTDCDSVFPWGWSPLLVAQLRQAGGRESLLPTDIQMEDFRNCSSRQTAVRLLGTLRKRLAGNSLLVGSSAWCTTESEVWTALSHHDESILKAPWSGSGRGLYPVHQRVPDGKAMSWVKRTLSRQGGVEVEPLYINKVLDLAMEFWVEPVVAGTNRRLRYEGLSLFETTPGGVYGGNLLATEAAKERRISQWLPIECIHVVRDELLQLLSHDGLASWYRGPVGVDMMLVQTPEGVRLHPLVELNHRMTMGWVACQLSRSMREGEEAHFSIAYKNGKYGAFIDGKGLEKS